VIAPNAAIAARIQAMHPDVPVIGFPKGSGEKLAAYARETGVNAVGVDETVDPLWAARELPAGMPVQGNLDPLLLLSGGAELEKRATEVLDAFADRPMSSTWATASARRRPWRTSNSCFRWCATGTDDLYRPVWIGYSR
jgi:uroporphyrinogen-III decarboxylase